MIRGILEIILVSVISFGLTASNALAIPCDEDVNIDSTVDVLDLLAVLAAWGETGGGADPLPEDVTGDGIVNVLDLLAVLAAWGQDCSPPEVIITPIVHVGDPVPGIDGAYFGYFSRPKIDAAGNVLFQTHMYGPEIDSTNFVAMYYGPPDAPELLAWMGEPAPDMGGEVIMKSLIGASPRVSETGWITFMAELSGPGIIEDFNDRASFAGPPGDIQMVIRGGDQAPGLEEGTIIEVGSWQWFDLMPNDNATLTFHGTLSGPGVDPTNDTAAWMGTRDDLQLVYREGMEVSGVEPGLTLWAADFPVFSDAMQYTFLGILDGEGIHEFNNQGRCIGRPGEMVMVTREGDQAPGFPEGVVFTKTGNLVATNNHGETNQWGEIGGPGITGENNRVLYAGDPFDLQIVAQEGEAAPEAGPDVVFESFGQSLINDRHEIFYKVIYRGSSIHYYNKWATYFGPFGNPQLAMRDEDHAPYHAIDTVLFYVGGMMALVAMNDVGDIVCPTEIVGPGITEDADVVLWMRHSDFNRWIPLLRSGDVIDGRTVFAAEPGDIGDGYENKTGGSDGWGESLNDSRQLVLKIEFTDGTNGIFMIEPVGER